MSRHTDVRAFMREYLPDEFASRVLERITQHDESLDESYTWASLRGLQLKLSEEIADVAGFAAIVATRTDDDRAGALLAAVAQRAAEAEAMSSELGRLLAREVST